MLVKILIYVILIIKKKMFYKIIYNDKNNFNLILNDHLFGHERLDKTYENGKRCETRKEMIIDIK